ncbi:NAD(P)-binding protein [Nostoc sp. 'Peltigera membranacea cyanobiont' 210A]|uniref:NAD(P)-binding protein n=1 Tax=Nostoc sp. 'Peltigera membranacea cyanobiont' 210A TaxID=2014529 RepID=UPI00295006DF|nr:NAD(P)-binding protein [Nostoc sp. 'Peltigera membranacea cyanobiont' 210A]
MTQPNERHALVIGGSIAGLLAAQVLTKYFNRVTIIERDHLSAQPEQRPGVPQAHHLHILLKPPSVFFHLSVLRQVLQRIIKKSDQNWNRSGYNRIPTVY